VFAEGDPKPIEKGSGRLELAEDIISQPITTRVFVNRIWKGHFDTGLVETPSNFGQMGERPSNPALLEYLAAGFAKSGNSVKALHRQIMLSSVYQLSSANDEANFAKDSGNRSYWRFNRRRLDAEQLRDSILTVSGNLDDAVGGPSEDLTPANKRRTVYGKVSRYKLDTYLQTFDFPAPNISAEKRFTTTVPLQRLFLMNSDFMQIEAEELAKRIAAEPDNRARIRRAYQLAYARDPNEAEIKLGLDYLHSEPLKEYEEVQAKAAEDKAKAAAGKKRGGKDDKPADPSPATAVPATGKAMTDSAKPAPGGENAVTTEAPAPPEVAKDVVKDAAKDTAAPEADAASEAAAADGAAPENAGMGMGMMDGVPGMGGRRGPGAGGPAEIKYDPTAWGRYAKVLLSATEFLFIN